MSEKQTPENLRGFKDDALLSDDLRVKAYGLAFGQAADTIEQLTRERDELEQDKAGLEERLEKIAEAWSDAIQSDFENGVQMLNELAADKFKHDYPSIFAMGEIINHSGEEK